jgi:creatinine amidohydrolase/Fe(II)-dependent formamide hydrolase-like protein
MMMKKIMMNTIFSRRRFLRSVGVGAGTVVVSNRPSSASAGLPVPAADQGSRSYVNPRRVLLWESTRKEIREGLQRGRLKAAIVPTGSTEQHNEHLALIADTAEATFMSQQAALRLYPQVTVSTPCPVGYSPYHMARKGTLTLRKEIFLGYVFDTVKCLKTHGFRTVLVVNGHGGNHKILQDAVPQWREELGITLDAVSYSGGYKDEELAEFLDSYRMRLEGKYKTMARRSAHTHASENETSIVMASYPGLVRFVTMEEYDRANLNYATNLSVDVREYLEPFTKTGWPAGGDNPENPRDRARQEQALLATVEKGEKLIAIATNYVAGKLQQMIDATEKGEPWPPAT